MTDVRWIQRLDNLNRAYKHLHELSLRENLDWVESIALIKLFEVVFELSWKTLKDYLYSEGITVKSPRETIKQAFQMELIEDGDCWLAALEKRNTTTHRYDEAFSKMLTDVIQSRYTAIFTQLQQDLNQRARHSE